jgi:hypothetical protein
MKIWSLSSDNFYRTTLSWPQEDSLFNVVLFYAPKKNCVHLLYSESEETASSRNGSKNLKVLRYHDLENRSLNIKYVVNHFISEEKYKN